jgi:hypothetical protein
VTVESVHDTGVYKTVYNFRVADFHTYFVGGVSWGFSIWAHNSNGCGPDDFEAFQRDLEKGLVDETLGDQLLAESEGLMLTPQDNEMLTRLLREQGLLPPPPGPERVLPSPQTHPDADSYLSAAGLTDPAVREAFVKAGFKPIDPETAPLTHQRFLQKVIGHAQSKDQWTGRLGDIETRTVTLNTAAAAEGQGLLPEFEHMVGTGRMGETHWIDLVLRSREGQVVDAIQFEKTDQYGNIIERQPGSAAAIKQLGYPVRQVGSGLHSSVKRSLR